MAIYLCRKWTGEGIVEIGAAFGGVSGQAVSRTALQVSNGLASDRRLREMVDACESVLMDKL